MSTKGANVRGAPGGRRGGVITVLLANDHDLVRGALRALLDLDRELAIVGETRGSAIPRAVSLLVPDVVVVDFPTRRGSASSAISDLGRIRTGTAVVITSFERSRELAQRLFDAGAMGFVLIQRADDELATAVHAAARGGRFLSPAVDGAAPEAPRRGAA